MLTEQLWVPPSNVVKSRKKIYLKVQTNTVLRVRQFQPSHAPLITELRGEILRIFLECGVSVYHVSINVPYLYCVFCVEYLRWPHTHSCSTFIINYLYRIGHCLFFCWYFVAMEMKLKIQVRW